jgi:uncharacterized protein YcbK (DUF882 family)
MARPVRNSPAFVIRAYNPNPEQEMYMNRREAMKLILKGAALASIPLFPQIALSSKKIPKSPNRLLSEFLSSRSCSKYCTGRLRILNAHSNEEMNVRYLKRDGSLDAAGLRDLDHLFRCHYSDEVHPIPPQLYALLDVIRTKLGAEKRSYELISGYRSPQYNRMLRENSRGVAKRSYHVKGMAADVCLQGVSLRNLQRAACNLKKGGVGRYGDFVHLDIGPVRSW